MIRYCYMNSPIGRLLLVRNDRGVEQIGFQDGPRPLKLSPAWIEDAGALADVRRELEEYCAGQRREFTVPLALAGTPFQLRVWNALLEIPYGETISYGELAARIGQPTASRAVGLANGANPIPVIVPCHRVIGSNGSLTGYGGGLPIKQRLLALERQPQLFGRDDWIQADDRRRAGISG